MFTAEYKRKAVEVVCMNNTHKMAMVIRFHIIEIFNLQEEATFQGAKDV